VRSIILTAVSLAALLTLNPVAAQGPPRSDLAEECQAVVSIHNRLIANLKPVYAPNKAANQNQWQKSAKIYDRAAQEMTNLTLQDENLGQIKNQFATMYRSNSKVMKQVMTSSGRKRSTALQKLAQAASPEKDLIDRLNTYCGN
jgi:transposase